MALALTIGARFGGTAADVGSLVIGRSLVGVGAAPRWWRSRREASRCSRQPARARLTTGILAAVAAGSRPSGPCSHDRQAAARSVLAIALTVATLVFGSPPSSCSALAADGAAWPAPSSSAARSRGCRRRRRWRSSYVGAERLRPLPPLASTPMPSRGTRGRRPRRGSGGGAARRGGHRPRGPAPTRIGAGILLAAVLAACSWRLPPRRVTSAVVLVAGPLSQAASLVGPALFGSRSGLVVRRSGSAAPEPPGAAGWPATASPRARGVVANMPACHAGDRRFESGRAAGPMRDASRRARPPERAEWVSCLGASRGAGPAPTPTLCRRPHQCSPRRRAVDPRALPSPSPAPRRGVES